MQAEAIRRTRQTIREQRQDIALEMQLPTSRNRMTIQIGIPKQSLRRTRRGATWGQFAFLLLLMALGLALFLPALQSSIEAARRTSCVCSGKQTMMGIQNFHDIRREICPAYLTDDQSPAAEPRDFATWPILLLPYMEEGEMYAMVDLRHPLSANVANHATVRSLPLPTHFCYSRRSPGVTRDNAGATGDRAAVSRADLGKGFIAAEPRTWDAAMVVSRAFNTSSTLQEIDGVELEPGDFRAVTNFDSVIDGLSNTTFISDKALREDRFGGHPTNLLRTADASEQDGTFYFGGLSVWHRPANLQAPGAIAYWSRRLAPDASGEPLFTRRPRRDDPKNRFGSSHPGIVLVTLGDGSLRAVNVAASNRVLQRLACRNDGMSFDLP